MYKKITLLASALMMASCSSLIATATGPEPIGQEQGSRTLSKRLEDGSIERTAEINMYKADPKFREANVNVISFYGSVLLAGQIPSEELKAVAENIVRQIAEVKQVHNELKVGPSSYYLERSRDGFISTRIRTALTLDESYPASRTKIFTVGGTVYLLGRLTSSEADRAVELIKNVSGVQKIIKLVDYLPAPAAPRPPQMPQG
ncbi:MAG: BON domain-containing protein [Pseudomonadota bacterium]